MKKTVFLSILFLLVSVCSFAAAALTLYTREETVIVDHANLYCRIVGQGPPMIVIHGGPGLTQDYLLPKMAKFGKNHQVYFYDQRGCGKSTCDITPNRINIKTYVADIEAIRLHYKLPVVTILGHSWGGFVAMQYAIAHPSKVDKLILMNSAAASSEDFSLFIDQWQKRLEPFKDDLKMITTSKAYEEGQPDAFKKYYQTIFKQYCFNPDKANELNLTMTRDAGINSFKVADVFRKNLLITKFNIISELKRLQIPTLIVHGDTDIVPVVIAENIHNAIAGSKLIIMKNCGNFPYIEDPDTFFKTVEQFLLNPRG